uniref:Uncharacterized protein n=1 Tax=Manihot esculenta TaxID=3983 RepID=A0A199UAT1_MANES
MIVDRRDGRRNCRRRSHWEKQKRVEKKKKYRALIPKRTQGIKEISMNILL